MMGAKHCERFKFYSVVVLTGCNEYFYSPLNIYQKDNWKTKEKWYV